MVASELSSEKVECREKISSSVGSPGSGLRKDPSFSGWVDEDGRIHLEHQLKIPDGTKDDSDFELPLLHHSESGNGFSEGRSRNKFPEGSVHLNGGGSNMDESSLHHRTDAGDRFVPFDVDHVTPSPRNTRPPKTDAAEPGFTGKLATLPSHARSSVSAADVSKTFILILVWYTFSTFLTLYNKTLLGDDLGKFPAPLLMNTIHFAMQAVLAKVITLYWSHRFQPTVPMSWRDYFSKVVPTALSTALDVDLSNESLVFISVTFATMCKSAAPIFLLLFAFAFRLETPSFKLLGIIVVISFGILLTVAKETEFDFWGFIFVILAAVMSGFRWCMTQILLQKDAYGLKNPLTFMSCVTPIMAVATAILSLILDPWPEFSENNYFNSSWNIARSCFLMLFGGTLAFFMVLTEYVLISVTSAVTVTIAGVVKEAVTILVAVFYFHDEFTWMKAAGLVTIMLGVSLFNWYKYQKLRKEHVDEHDLAVSSSAENTVKYVILEEMDDEADAP